MKLLTVPIRLVVFQPQQTKGRSGGELEVYNNKDDATNE